MMKKRLKNRTGEAPSPMQPKRNSKIGRQKETGGPSGPEPTRYGDWERKGRCIDF